MASDPQLGRIGTLRREIIAPRAPTTLDVRSDGSQHPVVPCIGSVPRLSRRWPPPTNSTLIIGFVIQSSDFSGRRTRLFFGAYISGGFLD